MDAEAREVLKGARALIVERGHQPHGLETTETLDIFQAIALAAGQERYKWPDIAFFATRVVLQQRGCQERELDSAEMAAAAMIESGYSYVWNDSQTSIEPVLQAIDEVLLKDVDIPTQ